ncbi:hypothetical protein NL676_006051 [Syzygium grande]|nr:hypothetical protein NL676_006051 [Syzygium grande]
MEFGAPDRRRARTQRLPPRRGQIKIAIFKKLLRLASLAVSRVAGRAGERRGGGHPGDSPVEARGRGRAPGGRRVHPVPDSAHPIAGGRGHADVRWRGQRLPPRRGQIKIAIFKKLLRLASLAVSRVAGRAGERRGGGHPGDGPVEARGRGRAPGGRRVHPVPDSAHPIAGGRGHVDVRWRGQRLPPRRGQIKIAIFKKLLRLASLAVSRVAGRAGERRGGGHPGDGPVEARGRGRAPGGRRVHHVPDSGGAMPT